MGKKKEKTIQSSDKILFDKKTGKFKKTFLVAKKEEFDKAFYETHIRTALADKSTREAILNMPDKKDLLREWLKKSESEVSDDEFFSIIRENPIFLGALFAQQKIHRWQKELCDHDKRKVVSGLHITYFL